jgi:ferritin
MITRRGSLLNGTISGDAILMYKPGDVVKPVTVMDQFFTGVVRAVDTKTNKITVAWGGGPESQHDSDEIMPMPFFGPSHKDGKTASRRMRSNMNDLLVDIPEIDEETQQNPPESVEQTDFIADDMEALLNRQVGSEFYSAYLYYMIAAVFQSKGLVGFQNWMEKQGDGEIDHAMKVYNYLVDTGSSLELPAVPSPKIDPAMEVVEITRAILDHEMRVTEDWKRIGQLSKQQDNPATCKLVQEFMVEQVEEEDSALTLHQKVQLADTGSGILMIDNDLRDRGPISASEKIADTHKQIQMRVHPARSCSPHDILIVSEGLQCGNCGAISEDHGKNWEASPGRWASEMTASGSEKDYNIMENVGRSRYVVNYHDGEKTHKDGSAFYDVKIFGNKVDLEKFEKELKRKGYKEASARTATNPSMEQFCGEPDTHGLDVPVSGGTSVMKDLAYHLHDEANEFADVDPRFAGIKAGLKAMAREVNASSSFDINQFLKMATSGDEPSAQRTIWEETAKKSSVLAADENSLKCNRCGKTLPPVKGYESSKWRHCPCGGVATRKASELRSRRAMYWCAPDRTFRLTKQEQDQGICTCPKCRIEMNKERFTRSDKLLSCPECGFKVPTSKAVTKVEVKVPAGVEVDVTTQNDNGEEVQGEVIMATTMRRGRFAYADPANLVDLPRMTLDQISSIVYRDWKNVNYAAKPYLEAMSTLRNVSDMYMADTGTSIVAYFLSNATSWRGDVAKAVKKELQRRIR